MVDRMDVVVHSAAQGISWMNQDEPGGRGALQPQPRRQGRLVPRPGRRRVRPAGARVTPGVPGVPGVPGGEAVMGWDWQVRPKEGDETRQATWAKGRRGTVSSGSAHPRSTPPAA